ncbi:MAG: hypothetical protein HY898_33515 [Deltaproteobacteria bacterium]|nr:hypothetical protein [Deltaproteobacteria bacterium]
MKQIRCRGWVAALCLCVFALTPLSMATAGKSGHIALVKGSSPGLSLRATPVSPWQPVAGEQPILPGGTLRTGSEGAMAALVGGTRVDMMPESALQLYAPTEVNLEPGPTTRVDRADLKKGMVWANVPQGGRPLLAVTAKDIMVAFRLGRGYARLTPSAVIVAVEEGSAKVANTGKWTSLSSGQYLVVHAPGRQEGPKPLPPAPTFSTDACHATPSQACAIAVVSGDGAARVGARWQPQASGCRYHVELMRGPDGGEVLQKVELEGDKTAFTSDPLPIGAYSLAVRAINSEGIEGVRIVRAMRVVRFLPDPGVHWIGPEQVFVAAPGRRVRMDGSPGLLSAWEGTHFLPVPAGHSLLARAVKQTFRLRIDSVPTDDVAVALEPLALRADARLTPQTAMWPRDRVFIDIRLFDPSHRIDPKTVMPRLRASINGSPIQVGLARAGDTWRAEIPARNGPGPWVIRTDVLDNDDNVIGQEILNVVGRESSAKTLW